MKFILSIVLVFSYLLSCSHENSEVKLFATLVKNPSDTDPKNPVKPKDNHGEQIEESRYQLNYDYLLSHDKKNPEGILNMFKSSTMWDCDDAKRVCEYVGRFDKKVDPLNTDENQVSFEFVPDYNVIHPLDDVALKLSSAAETYCYIEYNSLTGDNERVCKEDQGKYVVRKFQLLNDGPVWKLSTDLIGQGEKFTAEITATGEEGQRISSKVSDVLTSNSTVVWFIAWTEFSLTKSEGLSCEEQIMLSRSNGELQYYDKNKQKYIQKIYFEYSSLDAESDSEIYITDENSDTKSIIKISDKSCISFTLTSMRHGAQHKLKVSKKDQKFVCREQQHSFEFTSGLDPIVVKNKLVYVSEEIYGEGCDFAGEGSIIFLPESEGEEPEPDGEEPDGDEPIPDKEQPGPDGEQPNPDVPDNPSETPTYVRLKSLVHEEKCLDIARDSGRAYLADCNRNTTGTFWNQGDDISAVKLHNQYFGDSLCLETRDSPNQIVIDHCISSDVWSCSEVDASANQFRISNGAGQCVEAGSPTDTTSVEFGNCSDSLSLWEVVKTDREIVPLDTPIPDDSILIMLNHGSWQSRENGRFDFEVSNGGKVIGHYAYENFWGRWQGKATSREVIISREPGSPPSVKVVGRWRDCVPGVFFECSHEDSGEFEFIFVYSETSGMNVVSSRYEEHGVWSDWGLSN